MPTTYYLTDSASPHAASEREVIITDPAALTEPVRDADVVLNWNSRAAYRGIYHLLSDARIQFRFGDTLIDMSDAALAAQQRQQALSAGNYTRCKTINRALMEYAAIRRQYDLPYYPSEIQLETTDICNAECIMCSHFYRQGQYTVTRHTETLRALRDVLPFLDTVILHGNGEPFLVSDIDDYIAQMGAYGIKCTTNTNLSVLSEQNLHTIRQYFYELNVSVDGADEETYTYIRRGLSFQNLLRNCKRLREHCPDLYMRMWSIMMRQNIHKLSDLVRLAAQLGFNEIVLTELSSDARLKNDGDVMLHYPHTAAREIGKARETAQALGIRLVAPTYRQPFDAQQYAAEQQAMQAMPLFHDEAYFRTLREQIRTAPGQADKQSMEIGSRTIPCAPSVRVQGICDWPIGKVFVDLEGRVSLCCVNQHIVLGDLFSQSFEEIWNSASARNIRRVFYQNKLPYFCSGCEFILQDRMQFLHIASGTPELHQKIRLGGAS